MPSVGVGTESWRRILAHGPVAATRSRAEPARVSERRRRALAGGGCAGIRDDYADLPAVVDLCLRRGFSPVETAKLIGGNYVRVFRQVAAARKEAA